MFWIYVKAFAIAIPCGIALYKILERAEQWMEKVERSSHERDI